VYIYIEQEKRRKSLNRKKQRNERRKRMKVERHERRGCKDKQEEKEVMERS
jgi:hypothetical protein